jgi:hypothetical protein
MKNEQIVDPFVKRNALCVCNILINLSCKCLQRSSMYVASFLCRSLCHTLLQSLTLAYMTDSYTNMWMPNFVRRIPHFGKYRASTHANFFYLLFYILLLEYFVWWHIFCTPAEKMIPFHY